MNFPLYTVVEMKEEISRLKENPAQHDISQKPVPVPNVMNIQDEIREDLEKEKKKHNVVLIGVPENNKEQIRCEADRNRVLEICQKLKMPNDRVLDIFRDGMVRQTDLNGREYSRITKVVFASFSDKMQFLKGYKSCLGSDDRGYARHDLTLRQRQEENVLRAELTVKHQENPNIRRGKDGKAVIAPRLSSRPK